MISNVTSDADAVSVYSLTVRELLVQLSFCVRVSHKKDNCASNSLYIVWETNVDTVQYMTQSCTRGTGHTMLLRR